MQSLAALSKPKAGVGVLLGPVFVFGGDVDTNVFELNVA